MLILKNKLLLNIDLDPYITSIIRIIPVYGHNKMLITGYDDTSNIITLLYNIDNPHSCQISINFTFVYFKFSIYMNFFFKQPLILLNKITFDLSKNFN